MTIRAEVDPSVPTGDERPSAGEASTSASASGGRTTRYRYLIAVVSDLESTVTIDQLVDVMVRWEAVHGEATEKSWHEIHEELYRVDLPTLDRADLLEFDADAGTVTGPDRR